ARASAVDGGLDEPEDRALYCRCQQHLTPPVVACRRARCLVLTADAAPHLGEHDIGGKPAEHTDEHPKRFVQEFQHDRRLRRISQNTSPPASTAATIGTGRLRAIPIASRPRSTTGDGAAASARSTSSRACTLAWPAVSATRCRASPTRCLAASA